METVSVQCQECYYRGEALGTKAWGKENGFVCDEGYAIDALCPECDGVLENA
jgi:hypothetical protein